jgi:two-component system response regulator
MSERSILLVEDNEDDIDLTLRALRKNNIANGVVVARDGVEALAYFDEVAAGRKETPELILLDLKLPKIDGLEVLKRMRANPALKLLPVVVLTSSDEERDVIESYSLGANSFIRKPVDFDQFMEAVQRLGLYWLVMNMPPPIHGKAR